MKQMIMKLKSEGRTGFRLMKNAGSPVGRRKA